MLERPKAAARAATVDPAHDPAERQADEIGAAIGRDLGSAGSVGSGPVPDAIRSSAEAHLGVDLGGTELRADHAAARHADALGALAVTEGSRVSFANGQLSLASRAGRDLLGHELTHVAQQRAASTSGPLYKRAAPDLVHARGPQRQEASSEPASEVEFEAQLQQEVRESVATWRAAGGCQVAWSDRFELVMNRPGRRRPSSDDDISLILSETAQAADDENATLAILGDDALSNGQAFPKTWAHQVEEIAKIPDAVVATAVADFAAAVADMESAAPLATDEIVERGLPVDFEQALSLSDFKLMLEHAKLTTHPALAGYVRAVIQRMKTGQLGGFVILWNQAVGTLLERIGNCEYAVALPEYEEFRDNFSSHLNELPALLQSIWEQSELEQFDAGLLTLTQTALLAGAAATVFSTLGGILLGWTDGAKLFDQEILPLADAQIAQADGMTRLFKAWYWGTLGGYFVAADLEVLTQFMSQFPVMVAGGIAIALAQLVPGLDIALDVYLVKLIGEDVIRIIDELGTAINDVVNARSVVALQRASARLALAKEKAGFQAILDILGAKALAGGIRARVAKLRELDPKLGASQALERALKEQSGDRIVEPVRTGAEPGLAASEASIREGSVRMEQHPAFAEQMARVNALGFKVLPGGPRVAIIKVITEAGDVVAYERRLYVKAGMRYLDLEHELGHIDQLMERFGDSPPFTDVEVQRANGSRRRARGNELKGQLSADQDTIVEYHNRLVEFIRLKERGASDAVLIKHAHGVEGARAVYWNKGVGRGNSPSGIRWRDQHFPDLLDLEAAYNQLGGRALERAPITP